MLKFLKKNFTINSPNNTACNLIGHLYAPSGRGEDVRTAALAAESAGFPFTLINTFGDYGKEGRGLAGDSTLRRYIGTKNPYDINIFFINADEMHNAYNHLGKDFYTGKYNIGCWAWELHNFPAPWASSLDIVDEIWAPSRFIQEAISQRTDKPVIYMPLAVDYNLKDPLPGERFNIPADKFVFLTFFDFTSFLQRKNPFAVIKAFNQLSAALPPKNNLILVIKLNNWEHNHKHFNAFMRMVARNKQIVIIKEILEDMEMKSLIARCDCLVSLHRSEGFGRGPAEAMSLGKPVVVTGYSGNMDYCNEANAFIVDYRLIRVKPGEYPHADGQKWADADISHAVQCMRDVIFDPALARQKARMGKEYINKFHSPHYIGQRYQRRLQKLS